MTAKFICAFEIKTPEWEPPGPPAWGLSATVWLSGLWPRKPAPLCHRDSSWGVAQHVSEKRSLSRINLIYLPSLWLCAWMETSSLSSVSEKTKWGLQWKGLRVTPENQESAQKFGTAQTPHGQSSAWSSASSRSLPLLCDQRYQEPTKVLECKAVAHNSILQVNGYAAIHILSDIYN